LNAYAAVRIPEVGKARGEQKTTVRRQHYAVVLLQIFSLSIALLAPFCDRHGIAVVKNPDLLRYGGLLLYVVGFLIIIFAAGIALTFRSWLALVLDGGILLVLLWRIRDEEVLMCQEFGAEWDLYSRKTWRLVPFLY